jgi:lysine 2,3-aminomutase
MQKDVFLDLDSESSEIDEPPSLNKQQNPVLTKSESAFVMTVKKHVNEMIISEKTLAFKNKFFPNASDDEWNDWHWQIRNSFTSLGQLQKILHLSNDELKPIEGQSDSLPLRITPYYASLINPDDALSSIRRTVVPDSKEMIISEGEASDPLGEHDSSVAPNLVHRYPDRVLFLVTDFCASFCRYCTRSHMVAKGDKIGTGSKVWEQAFEYIRNHKEVRDVLVSGGDALTMTDKNIEYLLSNLRAIEHVEIIRIGSKVPVVLPQRITNSLTDILKKYHPLFMSLHFTHPEELSPEVAEATARLANAGIPLGSQTVLLKGINDSVPIMTKLMQGLLKIRVRPYYIYQCDPILGSGHFRTSVKAGLEIIRGLRGFTSGYAVPQFVIDAPDGGGKIPLLPNYIESWEEGGDLVLKNYKGNLHVYPDTIVD